jgi:hypothetical protein
MLVPLSVPAVFQVFDEQHNEHIVQQHELVQTTLVSSLLQNYLQHKCKGT